MYDSEFDQNRLRTSNDVKFRAQKQTMKHCVIFEFEICRSYNGKPDNDDFQICRPRGT
jgi:hypothetical protein